MATYNYYKRILREYILSAEFDEKIEKHCMSSEDTEKAVAADDRGDAISRFLISKENVKKTLLYMVDNNQYMESWCKRCSAIQEGEYITGSKNFPLSKICGETYTRFGKRECKNLFLKLSYYKSSTGHDRMKVVTFYPSPEEVKIHE